MDYIDLVDNARLEFAFSMTSHHVWVPIYLGAALVAAILETLYVTTGRIDYKTSSMYISKMLLPTFIVIIFLGIATPHFLMIGQYGGVTSRYLTQKTSQVEFLRL